MIDFCIIGMPKAGTSSLFQWLAAHPSVQGASPKETFFLMDEKHPLRCRNGVDFLRDGPDAYNKFFDGSAGKRLRCEATTHYFYQSVARNYLGSLDDLPRIVFLLREPAHRVLSSFRFTQENLGNCDRQLTFDRYVDTLLNGDVCHLDRYYSQGGGSLYVAKRELEFANYTHWIDWWLQVFPKNRIEVILFEELRQNPKEVTMRLCRNLGIDAGFYENFGFEQRNKSIRVGSRKVHDVVRRVARTFPDGGLREQLKKRYILWQEARAPTYKDYRLGLSALQEHLTGQIEMLSSRFDLDVSKWWGMQLEESFEGSRSAE